MSADSLELIARVDGERTQLLSPGVGLFSGALPESSIVSPAQFAGTLTTLGRSARLVVPSDVHGVIRSKAPARTRAPVSYGQVLYELAPLESENRAVSAKLSPELATAGDLKLRAPQSGRFYHRSAPGESSLCEIGRELEIGTPVGLIEVMKTFTQVTYRAERGLPARARIVQVVAKDGGDLDEGAVLLIVEPR